MRETFQPCVYPLASRRQGTLCIGGTSSLLARVVQHREGLIPGFTRRYGIRQLVGTRCTTRWAPRSFGKSG